MDVRPISAPEVAEFLQHQPGTPGSFLQTEAWGRFEAALGAQVEYLGFWEEKVLIGTALVTWRNLPGGLRYAYMARGPVLPESNLASALEALVSYYAPKRALFIRVEPPFFTAQLSPQAKFVRAPEVQPRATVVLNLQRTPTELLTQMHEKTRYNIRLSERKGLTWHLRGAEALDGFWQLLQTTTERDGFTAHSKDHYRKLLELYGAEPLSPSCELAVRVAEVSLGTELLAANLMVFSRGTVTYLHGASGNSLRELMPTYLLHWRTIQEAASLGFAWYDFWGVEPSDLSKPSWQGITRFKIRFGGQRLEYAGAFDYTFRPALYRLYQWARMLRHVATKLGL